MPTTPHDDEPPEGTYSLLDLQAMEAAGDIEVAMPGTAEAEAARREMARGLAAYDADLVAREGPDALTSDRRLRWAALEAERDPATIGHALARYREARGWSHEQLADWLGVTPTGLAAIAIVPMLPPEPTIGPDGERGPLRPMARACKLAEHFGADPDRLREALE